jgi:hypothetical protein
MRFRSISALAALIALSLVAELLMGCGANQRQKALTTALVGVNAAREGFLAWDEKHQQNIALLAKSYEEGRELLANYRENREMVVNGFELAYQGLAAAALVDDDGTSFEIAMGRIEQLYELLRVLMGDQAPAPD